MITAFSHPMYYTTDLDRAIAWYADKLGFEVSYRAGPYYASLKHPAMGRLDLHPSGTSALQNGHGAQAAYLVDDLDATVAELEGKGIKVNPIQETGGGHRHTWFWDCDDNVLGISES